MFIPLLLIGEDEVLEPETEADVPLVAPTPTVAASVVQEIPLIFR